MWSILGGWLQEATDNHQGVFQKGPDSTWEGSRRAEAQWSRAPRNYPRSHCRRWWIRQGLAAREAIRQAVTQGQFFNLSEGAPQELKLRVSKHQSDVEIKVNSTVEVDTGKLTAYEELERRTIDVSRNSSVLEVEMAK